MVASHSHRKIWTVSLGTPNPRIQTSRATAYMTIAAIRVRFRVRRASSTAALAGCVTSPETLAMRRILRQANRCPLPFMEEVDGLIRLAEGRPDGTLAAWVMW